MSEYGYAPAEDGQGDQFEFERRGYSRRQVDEFIARQNLQVRDLENRLTQLAAQTEHLKIELNEARQAVARAPHVEVSERVGQILKLAEDEAKATVDAANTETEKLRETAAQETSQLRADVKAETDKLRAEAQNHAEQLIAAAKEQAEHTISGAVSKAEQLTAAAKAEADRTVGEANSHAEKTVATAIGQAKQQLDEATARAAAVHDGAERRLNLLISRHTETMRRLTEVRDVVTTLVAGETARGSLEDEVNRIVGANGGPGAGASAGSGEGRPAGRSEPPVPAQRSEGHAEFRPTAGVAAEAKRSAMAETAIAEIPEAAEPLEELPAPPAAGQRIRPMGIHSPVHGTMPPGMMDRGERPDPLGPGHGGAGGGAGRPRPAEPVRHPTEPIRIPADEAKVPGDPGRHQPGGLGRPPLAPNREFDDTPVNGLSVD